MGTFLQDLRFAARQLWKHPTFTITAILTLALGIGANTAIFTVVQSILLAPLPYVDPSRIVALDTNWTDSGHVSRRVTGPDAADVRSQAHSLEALSMYEGGDMGVTLKDHAVFSRVAGVDVNFERVFGLTPIAGRLFSDSEAHHAALVSDRFARDNFGSAEAALGQTLRIENETLQITGVIPGSFDFPEKTQVWFALPLQPESTERTAFNYKAIGKLRAGVSVDAARSELGAISQRLQAAYPDANKNKQMMVVPLQEELTGKARPMLLLLFAAVGMILLIACVNVTHLELARSIERQRELAVRTALGSSRWQLRRLVMAESLLISLAGAALGIALAVPAVRTLVAMAPVGLPRAMEIHLNGWVLAFTLGLSLLTTVAASLVPARKAAKVDPSEALKQDSSRGLAGRSASALRSGLVVAEVAATFVLAVGAGLLLRTLVTLTARDMGYQTGRMLVVDADAPAHTVDEAQRVLQQYDQLFGQLAALPGVKRAAGIMGLPTGSHGSNGYYTVTGKGPMDVNHSPYADFSVASPGYFQTMGIPLKLGRDFNAQDNYSGQFVAVISESLARQSFGDANPIGKQIQCGLDSDKWMTIVGVVGDVRQDSPAANPGPTLYMPMKQHPFYATEIHIVLRTKVAPLTLMNAVQSEIMRTNSQIATKFTTMDTMVGESISAERFRSVLISSFAGLGLLLAMLGVYGMMAYSVAQRTFEIGVRMAFGAERNAILRMILSHTARLACWGIVLGMVASFAMTRLITSMLVGVSAADPLSLLLATVLLLITAAVAALAPAWRAAQVDPMVALRAE
ncbi:ABC transporter permease [Alloacidobacterium dinghuense]|uniref:ABC transporter permease n=1 Tax=Alloacidobacterium dinghuense TaxID=2763107 RepID=A0A7G8BJ17_9BACT|nr:ABC transporter permease [Alloacidobacterium dinghuense]QNI32537.1 ABC transporter permease [Alloacidobacterium dinghuense]